MGSKRLFARLAMVLLSIAALSAFTLPTYGRQPQQAIALMLPVYTMSAPTVNSASVQGISSVFDQLTPSSKGVNTDKYKGLNRLTVPNEKLDTFVEQYAATGGFYAFKPELAFSETVSGTLTKDDAEGQACSFLFGAGDSSHALVSDGALLVGQGSQAGTSLQKTDVKVSPPYSCFARQLAPPGKGATYSASSPTAYQTTNIYSSSVQATNGISTTTLLGMVVKIPLYITVGSQDIPLGGPGGHISLLFKNTDSQVPGLASQAPNLAAVSMPFYGRETKPLQRNGQDITLPARTIADTQSAIQQYIRQNFPDASNVSIPTPELFYDVSDAGTPQTLLEPKYSFSGIELTVNGQVITLRDLTVPAIVDGLGPSVAISAPTTNSSFVPGSQVTMKGSISGGVGPYSYSWELEDGTVIKSGSAQAAGDVSVQTNQLAAVGHNGLPTSVNVFLRVKDGEGVERSAFVTLRPSMAPAIFLPLTLIRPSSFASQQPAAPAALQATFQTSGSGNYDFGIEANNDYQQYGVTVDGDLDLAGVVPDANGFTSAMNDYGWNRKFNWRNASAWEKDWRDCSLGGGDCTYGVDRTDFVYYSGHGGPGSLLMTGNNTDSWVSGSKARFSTLRWAAFSSCKTLRAQPNNNSAAIRQWFGAFQGAHMLLGFNSNMRDIAFGEPFAQRMKPITFFGFFSYQLSIRDAWVLTAFNMNAGKPAYIYAIGTNGVNPVDNKLPKANDAPLPRPFPAASYHWVWWDE